MFVLETCSIPVMELSSPRETCLTESALKMPCILLKPMGNKFVVAV